ncbi:hypothetical protein ACIQMR_04960 [Streptomyces sp. NPDC091376]|uniref:hypothetical protein n=1 Tax=Streptomyces sp. NPDC091376 TaxID=3365994 RepID=UPI00380B475A
MPIAPGLTPHGLRHTHKTLMREVWTPPKLMDERMGDEDGCVQSRYDHITSGMRQTVMIALRGCGRKDLLQDLSREPLKNRSGPVLISQHRA